MGFSLCCSQVVLMLLLVHCGVSAEISQVPILYTCGYLNNCRGLQSAMVWCQNTLSPEIRFNTRQLNITNAMTSDIGMYHCCNVSKCCSGDSVLSTLNVTVYAHAMVSPADMPGTVCKGQMCVVSYDIAQRNIEISNGIGYYPQHVNDRQDINRGHWRVINSAGNTNTIYTCNISSCQATTARAQFDIGNVTFMGDYGDRVSITDLESLNSTLKLVYSIEPVPFQTTPLYCRYSAQRTVTYSFEVTSASSSSSSSLSPSASSGPTPTIQPVVTPNPSGGIDSGSIAGIAASIVGVCLILIMILVVSFVAYRGKGHCRHKETYKSESIRKEEPMTSSSVQYLHNGLTAPTTVVTSKSSHSVDSGHPPVQDPLSPGEDANSLDEEEGAFVISLPTDDQAETPTKAAAGGDSTSLDSNFLRNFGSENSAAV